MSSGGTTWASLGRRDERKKDDPLKRAVVGGEIKTKEKKRGLKNVVEEGHPNHRRRLEDVVEKKLKSAHNQNKQTNISFARIDRAVVAINRFTTDTDEEIEAVRARCEALGFEAVIANVWAEGGAGAEKLASTLVATMESNPGEFAPLYDWEQPVTDKIEKICQNIYGASSVDYSPRAKKDLRTIKKLGLEGLPICMAKTQKSLSDDPTKIGRPTEFEITVREIEIAAGAGFLIPITGDMMRMPGLPAAPSSENIDIDSNGEISGLF